MSSFACLAEKNMSDFFSKIHEFTTSMNHVKLCLFLFVLSSEDSFINKCRIVSYKITEYIRKFILQHKVSLLQSDHTQTNKRFIRDVSSSRILLDTVWRSYINRFCKYCSQIYFLVKTKTHK